MRNLRVCELIFVFLPTQNVNRPNGVLLHKTSAVFPSKQPMIPSKHVPFSNAPQAYQDWTNTSSKYADLFITPQLNPNMYSFEAPLPAYPLDTVIPTSYPVPQKTMPDHVGGGGSGSGMHFAMAKKSPATELENLLTTTRPVSPTAELENMLKIPESEFNSLLSVFAPSNGEQQEGGAGDFAIPSAGVGIFDSFPPEVFQETGSSSAGVQLQPKDAWQEREKWGDVSNNQAPSNLDPASFWIPSTIPPLFDDYPSLDRDLTLPSTSSSPPSSYSPPSHYHHHHHTPTISPSQSMMSLPVSASPGSAGGNRHDVTGFDDQLDFLDGSLDWDSILPPSKKFQEFPPTQSEASSPVSHMHISPATTPVPSSPPSPVETKPDINPSFPHPSSSSSSSSSSSPSTPSGTSEKSSKQPPLLFGKTEDEILLKVLVPRLGLNTKPVTRNKLVSMSVEEFNRLLDLAGLNDIEVAFMKEWRRRGKNKTAAMVARKRKRDELSDLDVEVDQLRKQKAGMKAKYDQLRSDILALKERTRTAEERVFQRYSRQSGIPVSRETHLIHVDKAGKVFLGPHPSSQQMLIVK